jgi:hypothetical protein
MGISQLSFEPYRIYMENQKYINNFSELTNLAYGLTLQLLFKYPRDKLPKIRLPRPERNELSYSMAEGEAFSLELECRWLTFSQYADKCNLDLEDVEREAADGRLGPVLKPPNREVDVIIWPPRMQTKPLSELPKPGVAQVRVTFQARVPFELDLEDDFDQVQNIFLTLAHSRGEPEAVVKRAAEILYRSCFILQWTIFEVFVRHTVQELIRRHPSKLAAGRRGKKCSVSYDEVLEMTENLSSVETLRDTLIQREVERLQSGGESVHGLINFLKSEFHFENDPYEAWYVLDGERYTTHYQDIIELKEVRNVLVHDGGIPPDSFFETYPTLSRRDSVAVIDERYYERAVLILSSVAYSIAKTIDKGAYKADDQRLPTEAT